MAVTVSFTGAERGGMKRRWYVWKETRRGVWRKTRLGAYVRRMRAHGHHEQVARVMAQAIRKGYRLPVGNERTRERHEEIKAVEAVEGALESKRDP